MSTFTEININTWARKRLFEFFKSFEEPYFNISANVDLGRLPEFAKENGFSFNLCCLFFSQKVTHQIEEFKHRILEDKVISYDKVSCGTTILLPDNTFSFCYFDHTDDLTQFDSQGKKSIEALKQNKTFNPSDDNLATIHYSTIPWISFTSIKHPRRFSRPDSVPKIVFGKWFKQNGRNLLPVSVEAHHGLMDGYHMGKYFSGLESEFLKI